MLPPEARVPGIAVPLRRSQYFVLHAPRQTGKTTLIAALVESLRRDGEVAIFASLESARGVDEVGAAELVVLDALVFAARALPPADRPAPAASVASSSPGARLQAWLGHWAEQLAPRRLLLMLDEVDALRPEPLLSVLAQLRSGYPARLDHRFPASVGLVGLRDLRDYVVAATGGRPLGPNSPFNIKVESYTLPAFTEAEITVLYAQHTADTGQAFAPGAVARALHWSEGQPYLVNALAQHCVDKLVVNRELPVLAAHIDQAAEHLVHSRVTHLDNLAERLGEPRVAAIVQNVLLGDEPWNLPLASDDFLYVQDLGLITVRPDGAGPANPIYREVLLRQLSVQPQGTVPAPWWPWVRSDGRLDVPALIDAFVHWWRRNADTLGTRWAEGYPEAVPHLVFMGFLQRVVNGGGRIEREYASGRGRIDIVIEYAGERHVIEVKRVPPVKVALETVVDEGIAQLGGYLAQLQVREGWMIVFDQRPGRTWDERTWRREVQWEGRSLHLVGA